MDEPAFSKGDKVLMPGGDEGTVIEHTDTGTLVSFVISDPSFYAKATTQAWFLPGELRKAP
jgi:hypothetical protein